MIDRVLPVYPVRNAPVLSACTSDQSCWDQVARWMDRCCSGHEACRESQPDGWAPTRIVDVLHHETGSVRVVSSSSIPNVSSERYVALSHCWGKQPFRVMSKKNRKEFGNSLLVSSLAPNFQDAIRATWKLGLRYLWIDSLCIVQGCEKNWHGEAPMMNQIYRHAFLTLAAAASPDAYLGMEECFRKETQTWLGCVM